ncbi:ABC transporter permease [Candidatus Omnitrophota bacterium]
MGRKQLLIKELLAKRDLLVQLVLKNLKIRYSTPVLGFFWAFLSPFLTGGVFYLVFSVILKVKIEEAPFFLYLMTAIFPWRFFQESLLSSATSLVDNRNLIKESGFAHYLIPVSIVLANAVIFLPSLVILIIICLFVLKGLGLSILLLPFVLTVHLALTIGLAIFFSVVYVRWRDIKYVLEIALLLLFYITPVFYSIYLVKSSFTQVLFRLYTLNPFVGILNLYRIAFLKGFYGLLQDQIGNLALFVVPVSFAVLSLILGFCFYNKNKERINDYLAY